MGLQGRDALAHGFGREAAREQLRGLQRAALLCDGELRLGAREARAGQLQEHARPVKQGREVLLGRGVLSCGGVGGREAVSRRLGRAARLTATPLPARLGIGALSSPEVSGRVSVAEPPLPPPPSPPCRPRRARRRPAAVTPLSKQSGEESWHAVSRLPATASTSCPAPSSK